MAIDVTKGSPGRRNGAGAGKRATSRAPVPLRPTRRKERARPADFFFARRDEHYLQQLGEESEFWDCQSDSLLAKTPAWGLQQYQNERLTGDPSRLWYETISDYGEFARGCVIGAGPGIVERHLLAKHPRLHLTVYDISRASLARLDESVDAEFPGRVECREQDLNFVTLPRNAFDLVVSQACVHHILNLEHLAYEVNEALTPDGLFFMMDNVGESYFQFSDEKKRIFQMLLDATRDGEEREVYWPDRNNWQFSPFEAVRSGDIIEVFGAYLDQVGLRTASSLLEMMLFVGQEAAPPGSMSIPKRAVRKLRRGLFRVLVRVFGGRLLLTRRRGAGGQLMLELDGYFCDTGSLQPGIAFAIYRKRTYVG